METVWRKSAEQWSEGGRHVDVWAEISQHAVPGKPRTGALPACKSRRLLPASCQETSRTELSERDRHQKHLHQPSAWHTKPSGRMLRDTALNREEGRRLLTTWNSANERERRNHSQRKEKTLLALLFEEEYRSSDVSAGVFCCIFSSSTHKTRKTEFSQHLSYCSVRCWAQDIVFYSQTTHICIHLNFKRARAQKYRRKLPYWHFPLLPLFRNCFNFQISCVFVFL